MNSITTNKGKRSQKMSLAALIHLMIRSFSFIMLCILRWRQCFLGFVGGQSCYPFYLFIFLFIQFVFYFFFVFLFSQNIFVKILQKICNTVNLGDGIYYCLFYSCILLEWQYWEKLFLKCTGICKNRPHQGIRRPETSTINILVWQSRD